MYNAIIPKKLGKIFKNNELSLDERVLLVKTSLSDIIVYIHYKYSSIDPTLHDKTRIATIIDILSVDVDGFVYRGLFHIDLFRCINYGISYLIERCNYTEVWLPKAYSDVCIISNYYHEYLYEHISFYK